MKENILIVEDEFIVANDLRLMLEKHGYNILGIVPSVKQARTAIQSIKPDIILLDIILKGTETGIDFGKELFKIKIPFLYISATTDFATLESVKKTQPVGFIVKPFRERDLLIMLDIARYKINLDKKTKKQITGKDDVLNATPKKLIGNSNKFIQVLKNAAMVAGTNTSVLLLGESGTGKEQIAQYIRQTSNRAFLPFVTVNCGALPENLIESELFGHEKGAFTDATDKKIGKFEQANGGTIFLDEIGELPVELQTRLLRVLQEQEIDPIGAKKTKKIDVRVIAATNRNLEKEVAEGNFRIDLYYRLNVFPIRLPSLRERHEDIIPLAEYFIKKIATNYNLKAPKLSTIAISQLTSYQWPGNIRELENLMERCVILFSNEGIIHEVPLGIIS